MKKVKAFTFMLIMFVALNFSNANIAFAQTDPTITSPAVDNGNFNRSNFYVTWSNVTGASYKISVRDTTTNMLVLNGVSTGTSTSYTIPIKYLYEGHSYRIAVSATVGTTVTWGVRIFNINLSSTRNSLIQRGNTMNNYSWVPSSNVRGWKNQYTYSAGSRYYGLPYSQTSYQSSITSVPWSQWANASYFDVAIGNPSQYGFYSDYTSNGIIMPKYGNDCSAYVSICWNIARHTTTGDLTSHPKIGKSTESSLKKYARMSPGDAFVNNDHTFMVKSISPVNDSSGNLVKLKFTCDEQTLYWCKESNWYSDTCSSAGYAAILKNSTLAQDYTWDWQ